jgi:1-aminocyclopropane-1-carboxylate deaminase
MSPSEVVSAIISQTVPTHPLPEWQGEGRCDVLRLDKLDAVVSGNKIFKLMGHLQAWQASGCSRLLSFGGAYSNHLHALAAVCAQANVALTLMVRGFADLPLTPTLADCQRWGAQLQFCNRQQYALRYDEAYRQHLAQQWDAWVIPEGGGGVEGRQGCALLAERASGYDEVWLALGTGTTALGMAAGLAVETKLVGVNCVADQGEQQKRWQRALGFNKRWQVLDEYHGGGFGRCPDAVKQVIQHYDALELPLDPVYTAKVIWALEQEQAANRLTNVRRLIIHTGGLQGRRSMGLSPVPAASYPA